MTALKLNQPSFFDVADKLSIPFPPLLSLDKESSMSSSPSDDVDKFCGKSATLNEQWFEEPDLDGVHDCAPLSEGRRLCQSDEEGATCSMHHSRSMPSFINLKKMESNSHDFIAASPNMCAAEAANTDHDVDAAASTAAAEGDLHLDIPFPTYIPKLRIRKISSEMDLKHMPSPLARRGGTEIEYLQKQQQAEALIRRKQQLHNEERKMRHKNQQFENFSYAPNRRRLSRHNNTMMDLAASPPAFITNTFKRTVSETLKDSGIPEDANLLFTPKGRPLLSDEDVMKDNNDEDSILGKEQESSSPEIEVFTMDEEIRLASVYESKDEGGVNTSPLNADNISASSPEVGDQLCDSSIDNTKSNSPTNITKKITLRPKMKVRMDSCDFLSLAESYACESTDQDKVSTCGDAEQNSKDGKMKKGDIPAAAAETDKWKFSSPQKPFSCRPAAQRFTMIASESFDASTLEDKEAITNDSVYNRRKFSVELDVSDRMKGWASPSFPEFNYTTPDNSYSKRHSVRSRLYLMSQEDPDMPLNVGPSTEQNVSTPGSTQSRRHSAPELGATIEEETNGFIPSMPSIEMSYETPEKNVLFATSRRASRSSNLLSIPQFAELVVPQLVSPTKPTEVGYSPSSEEKKEIDEVEPLDLESYSEVH